LVPSLGRAKGLAREMLCKSNLSGIGKAAEMYASDNGGYVPRDFWYGCNNPNAGHQYGHYFFASKFAQYVGGRPVPIQYDDNDPYLVEVFREIPMYKCPCVLQAEYTLTYVANGVDFDYYRRYGGYDSAPASLLATVPGVSSEVAYIVEADINLLPPKHFGTYDVYAPWGLTFVNGVPNPTPRAIRYDDQRHAGRTTVLFFDGHSESRELHPEELPVTLFNPLDT